MLNCRVDKRRCVVLRGQPAMAREHEQVATRVRNRMGQADNRSYVLGQGRSRGQGGGLHDQKHALGQALQAPGMQA
jgi:hypothetical protein